VSTCKAFDIWLCNPRVSGRGGSGPGRPSGMPRECTWITAREEACSEEGGGVPVIQMLGSSMGEPFSIRTPGYSSTALYLL